jgi:hypothetical protein
MESVAEARHEQDGGTKTPRGFLCVGRTCPGAENLFIISVNEIRTRVIVHTSGDPGIIPTMKMFSRRNRTSIGRLRQYKTIAPQEATGPRGVW